MQLLDDAHQMLRQQLKAEEKIALDDIIDGQLLLRERTAQASFAAGFRLAWKIAGELSTDTENENFP